MSATQPPDEPVVSSAPKIVIEEVGPSGPEVEGLSPQTQPSKPSSISQASRLQVPGPTLRRSSRKRSASEISEEVPEEEVVEPNMTSHTSKHKSEGSSKKHHGSSTKKERRSSKTDDWSEITEPEERRRIQNRIAQRKFRKTPMPFQRDRYRSCQLTWY
jgi:hypothetical protein